MCQVETEIKTLPWRIPRGDEMHQEETAATWNAAARGHFPLEMTLLPAASASDGDKGDGERGGIEPSTY
jgi:hypothetical protein